MNATKLKCNKNGDFTILVIGDPQCHGIEEWTKASQEAETLAAMSNPDFVLIDGDLEDKNVLTTEEWIEFIKPFTSRNIPWSTLNGNHDPFKAEVYEIYKNSEGCLNSTIPEDSEFFEEDRPLNYHLPIYSNDGEKIVFSVYGMDSGNLVPNIGWDGFTLKQLDWYKRCSDSLTEANGGKPVTSLLCCHIPLAEARTMKFLAGTDENDDPIFRENECTSDKFNRGTLDLIKKQNDIKIAVFGHSHSVNAVGIYDGILLGYTGKLAPTSIASEKTRGGRIIKFNQNSPEKFITKWLPSNSASKEQPEICLP